MEELLQRKAAALVAKQVTVAIKGENHLVLHWKDERGFSLSYNITWAIQNTGDVRNIFAIMEECQKELKRRGLNRAS